jgi:hypothetical protein
MKAWSEQAEVRLREWLAQRVKQEGLRGAEADELAADLRRHVHEDLENSACESVSLMALESVLERMGAAEEGEGRVKRVGLGFSVRLASGPQPLVWGGGGGADEAFRAFSAMEKCDAAGRKRRCLSQGCERLHAGCVRSPQRVTPRGEDSMKAMRRATWGLSEARSMRRALISSPRLMSLRRKRRL